MAFLDKEFFEKLAQTDIKTNKSIATNEDGTYTIDMPNGIMTSTDDGYDISADSMAHSFNPNYLTEASKQRYQGDIEARADYLQMQEQMKNLAIERDRRAAEYQKELDDAINNELLGVSSGSGITHSATEAAKKAAIIEDNYSPVLDGLNLDGGAISGINANYGVFEDPRFIPDGAGRMAWEDAQNQGLVKIIGGDFKAKPDSDNMGRIPEMFDVWGGPAGWYNEYQNPNLRKRSRGYSDVRKGLTESGLSGVQKFNRAADNAQKAAVAGARSVYDVGESIYDVGKEKYDEASDWASGLLKEFGFK